MEHAIILYLTGLTATASLLMAWFNSTLPVHVFHILRRVGYKAGDNAFWKAIPEWESTWEDWAVAVAAGINPFASELLTCPVCLSFHLSFWVAAVEWLLVPGASGWLVPAAAATWPVLANILMGLSSKH